jgi:hypothetical protein
LLHGNIHASSLITHKLLFFRYFLVFSPPQHKQIPVIPGARMHSGGAQMAGLLQFSDRAAKAANSPATR